jgi:hypothetical protein
MTNIRSYAAFIAASFAIAQCALAQPAPKLAPGTGAVVPAGPAEMLSYAALVDRGRLAQKDKEMQAAFPATPTGVALARVATLYPYGLRQHNRAEAKQMSGDLGALAAAPAAALRDLRAGLARLPEKYWAERQFLVQMAARWKTDPGARVAFLQDEIARPVPKEAAANPGDLSAYTAAVAADALLEVLPDPKARATALTAAMKRQPDPNVRVLVLTRHEMVDPAGAKSVAQELGIAKR